MADLLKSLRSHLVAAGVARVPATAGSDPPMWLEPRDGVKAPGEGDGVEVGPDAVLAAYLTGGIPARPYESELRLDVVDIWIRSTIAPTAFAIEADLRAALIDRHNWTMGGLQILESQQWRALQRLGSDKQGFTHLVSYIFDRRA